jgi:hypothetical protein
MPDWAKDIRAAIARLKIEPAREAALVEELSQHLSDRYHELTADGVEAIDKPSHPRRQSRPFSSCFVLSSWRSRLGCSPPGPLPEPSREPFQTSRGRHRLVFALAGRIVHDALGTVRNLC